VDEKGRLKVPAEFKRTIEEKYGAEFYITSQDGKVAQIFPVEEWRKIEEKLAQNIKVSEIKSRSRAGLSVVYAEVDDRVTDTAKEFDDIKIKLDSLTDLPQGAGPVQYIKEFGETSALMLTVASPRADGAPLELLAKAVQEKIHPGSVNIALCGTGALDHSFLREAAELMSGQIRAQFRITPILADGNGFVLITGIPAGADVPRAIARLWDGLPQRADLHPDVWDPIAIAPGAPVVASFLPAPAGHRVGQGRVAQGRGPGLGQLSG